MKRYEQRVEFKRTFYIEATCAEEANQKLQSMVDDVEWNSEVEHQGLMDFEDEPVPCPHCNGTGYVGESDALCPQCNGDCTIPFKP